MINEEYYKKIKDKWDNIAKPLDSLGQFEIDLSEMGAILKDEAINIEPAALVVLIADNGMVKEGVSQSDEEVTLNVAKALGKGYSSVCHMAKGAGVTVYPVNMGIKNATCVDGVTNDYFIMPGTNNFAIEPAMTTDEVDRAIEAGKKITDKLWADGIRMILLGEMGIGNTTTSTAVIAAILGIDPTGICGRGAGLSDAGLSRKCQVIIEAIDRYDLYHANALEVLRTVGGLDIAAMVGIILRAKEIGVPVILDGLITAAAALVAKAIDEATKDVVFFSHDGKEQGIRICADDFGARPVISANLALGEGTGAVMYYLLLKNALTLYKGNTLFSDISMEKYERLS